MRCSPACASEPPMTIDRRVDEAHAGREHLADVATGLPHRLDRVDVAALHELDDVLTRGGRRARCARQRPSERGAGGERLEASAVAARARHVGAARDVDVADVAGGALGAALQESARDDAGADAGRHLHEDQVVDVGPGVLALAERHDVHVVVDQHGSVEAWRANQPGTSKRSQPGMIGGLMGRPVECSTGPGSPMPIASRSRGLAAEPASSSSASVDHPGEHAPPVPRRHR